MRWIVIILLTIAFCVIAPLAWVRLAPSDPAAWHRMPDDVQAADLANGAIRIIKAGAEDLARLDAIVRGTERTRVLAGSPGEGMITYITRSAAFGFPDYTTIRLRDGQIELFGRARYGVSDLRVNATRIDGWLEALAQRG